MWEKNMKKPLITNFQLMVAGFLKHQLAATMWLGGARIVGIELGHQFRGQLCLLITLENG